MRRTEGQGKAWRGSGLVLGTPQGKNPPTVKKRALASICGKSCTRPNPKAETDPREGGGRPKASEAQGGEVPRRA